MQIGEVCLYTDDVVGLANFYKDLLGVYNDSGDDVHQCILTCGTGLTIYNDGKPRGENHQNSCIAFTVADVDAEYARVTALGAKIVQPPMTQPWGARNMLFCDPAGNLVVFRQLPQ